MSTPVPAPRSVKLSEGKKPVPKPRTAVPVIRQKSDDSSSSSKNTDESTSTFSRRVKSASKQIAGDIGDLVHERKRAVIEGTRQSVRKITRRFSSAHQEVNVETPQPVEDEPIDVFNSIRFQSPINECGIYNNINDSESVSSDDFVSLPPPLHPPPPLREEAIYDAPQSVASSSTESSGRSPVLFNRPEIYESVFPVYPHSSDTDSGLDVPKSQTDLSRSGSWKFYDPVTRPESTYSNIDSTLPIQPQSVAEITREVDNLTVSDVNANVSALERTNSLYENYQPKKQKTPRPSESVIFQFDPLIANRTSYENITLDDNNRKLLDELLQGELYGTISNSGTLDDISISNESDSGEYLSPPPPPARVDSLPNEEVAPVKQPATNTSWFAEVPSSSRPLSTVSEATKKSNWLKQVNEALKKAPEVVKGMRNKDVALLRPALGPKSMVQHKGMLYKVQSGPVEDLFGEFSGRWCVLENSNLVCYSDNTCDNVKEHFPTENILSVQILLDQKYRYRYVIVLSTIITFR